MCIKCKLKKLFLEAAGVEEKSTLIGKLSSDLILTLNLAENDLEKIKADTEAQLTVLVMRGATKEEALEELTAKYEESFTAASQKVEGAYNEIYKALGIEDEEGVYRIDQRTGEVFRKELVKVEEAPVAEGTH
jgi:hypothetical protein